MGELQNPDLPDEDQWGDAESADTLARSHRFLVRFGDYDLMRWVRSVKFRRNKIYVTFYFEESVRNFIADVKEWSKKLLHIELLHADGSIFGYIDLANVIYKKFNLSKTILDYNRTDIMTIDLMFSFDMIGIKVPNT